MATRCERRLSGEWRVKWIRQQCRCPLEYIEPAPRVRRCVSVCVSWTCWERVLLVATPFTLVESADGRLTTKTALCRASTLRCLSAAEATAAPLTAARGTDAESPRPAGAMFVYYLHGLIIIAWPLLPPCSRASALCCAAISVIVAPYPCLRFARNKAHLIDRKSVV